MTLKEQRHPLILLFTDISGSTRLSALMEPEDYAEMLGQLRQLLTTVVSRHGGEVLRIDGDGALCMFGYPIAHEDSARRAVEAALDIHAGAAMLAIPGDDRAGELTLHSGIHGGVVLMRQGDLVRGRYEVLGDATNIAARLCDAARSNQVLVSDFALGSDRHFFTTEGSVDVAVAGHDDPVRATIVSGRGELSRRYATRQAARRLPLVARNSERRIFADWLGKSTALPEAMLISARPGLGKSRLIEQLAIDAAAAGWRVEQGWCEFYLSAQVLQPFRQIAGKVAPGLPHRAMAAPEMQTVILDAARAEPLLLIIDDWQWSDDASREFIRSLAAGSADAGGRLRFLMASRDTAPVPGFEDDRCAQLALRPFGLRETRSAVAMLVPHADVLLAERIHDASGGIPLLIEELCHGHATGRPDPGGDNRQLWFDIAVQARSETLPAIAQDLLKCAAVIGHHVPTWLLAAAAGNVIRPACLDQLVDADFLDIVEQGDFVRFKHGLTRDAIYAGLNRKERIAIHRTVLDALEQRAAITGERMVLDALAHHSVGANDSDRAIRYAIDASDAALADGALDRAQAHIEAVLPLAMAVNDPGIAIPAMYRLLGRFGRASIFDPSGSALDTLTAFRQFFLRHDETDGVIRSAYWLGGMTYGLGDGKASVRHLEQALSLCSDGTSTGLSLHIRLRLAQAAANAGRFNQSVAMLEDILREDAQIEAHLAEDALYYARLVLAFLTADRGDKKKADAMFDQLAGLAEESNDLLTVSYASYAATASAFSGRWDRVRSLAEWYRPLCLRAHARMHVVKNDALSAYADWKISRSPESLDLLERSVRWFYVPGHSAQRATIETGWLIDALADAGDERRAREHAHALLGRMRRTGDSYGVAIMWRSLARLAAAKGDRQRCDLYLARADRAAKRRGSARDERDNALWRERLTSH